jgi:hypothetical protein
MYLFEGLRLYRYKAFDRLARAKAFNRLELQRI